MSDSFELFIKYLLILCEILVQIVISHPDEYLISVKGWYDSSNVIQGIQFKTNKTTSENFGYEIDGDGTEFTLQVQDKKIIGFHGFASNHLNSIGAYFVPLVSTTPSVPPKKLKAEGGEGTVWDDGSHGNVKKVSVGQGDSGVTAVMFEYTDGSQVIIGVERGKSTMLGFEGVSLKKNRLLVSLIQLCGTSLKYFVIFFSCTVWACIR